MGKKATHLLISKLFILYSLINALFIILFSNNLIPFHKDYSISGYIGFIIPILIIINLIFIVIWLIKKKWIISIILIIGLFCSYNFLKVRYIFNKDKVPTILLKDKDSNKNIKILTYNIANFIANDKKGLIYLSRVLTHENIDIACFQEFRVHNLTNDSIGKIFKEYPYFYNNLSDTSNNVNTAIFSKYPLDYVTHNLFPLSNFEYITTQISTQLGKINLITAHFQTSGLTTTARNYYELKKKGYNMGPIQIINSYSNNFEYNNILRKNQIDIICDSIKNNIYPTILCGDYNDVPLSYLYNKSTNLLVDGFLESGNGYMYTYKNLKKLLRIDYIFYSKNFKSIKYYSPNLPFSDHNPVICELEVRKN